MGRLLHRLWHSPRSGPVVLILVGLPVLLLGVLLAVFPVLVAVELLRGAFSPGYVPFARSTGWYLALGSIGWVALLAVFAQLRRIGAANRGLEIDFAVTQIGRPRSARTLAKRIGDGLAEAGCDVSEVIEEDYGAGVWLATPADRFWLAVSESGEREAMQVTLSYDPGPDIRRRLTRRADRAAFDQLGHTLRGVLAADPALLLQAD